jgi:hypothetical protein
MTMKSTFAGVALFVLTFGAAAQHINSKTEIVPPKA